VRVAIAGLGAIGQHVASLLEGRCEIVGMDRTRSPLRTGEAPVDAAIVATKTPGTRWAAEQVARVLSRDGVALTIQNGVGNREILVEALGEERVALGVIYVGAGFRADGTHYATGAGRLELGRPSGRTPAARLEALAELLRAGGADVVVVDDAWRAVWRKVVANAVMNPPSALLDASYGALLRDPATAMLLDALARESARIVTAAGHAYREEEAVAAWRKIATAMTEHRSSMHADVARHLPTEIDAINGALVREAQRHGLEAPLNQAMTVLVYALRPSA
jgi:2-dehydropantoate 2-reductase